VFVLLKGC